MAIPPKREKFAAPPPRRGGGAKTAPPARESAPNQKSEVPLRSSTPHRGPAAPPAQYINPASAAVKEMQKAILHFADVAASTDVTSMTGNKSGRQVGNQSRLLDTDMPESQGLSAKEDEHKEQLGGSDPFGNFLVQQYVVGDPVGRQYLNVDVAGQSNREHASMENANLRGMIDSIRRLGTPGTSGEKAVDGIWAYRTDKAVKNCYAIANALFNFSKDLGVKSSYSQENLEAFKKEIPSDYTALKDPNTKIKTANAITEHVKAITSFFQSLKSTVLTNKDLRQYIDQKKEFAKYKKELGEQELKPEEQALLKENLTQAIPGVNFNFIKDPKKNWISLNELQNIDSFKSFIKRVNENANIDDAAEVKKYLDEVNQALQSAKL